MTKSPWLFSPGIESSFILAPAFVSVALALVFQQNFESTPVMPLWAWVVFVLMIDVSHVYGSLFRSYANQAEWREHRTRLIIIPVLCWVVGALLYSVNDLWFWRLLAYLAVFHFIRQQYGFLMLYSRQETAQQRRYRWIDQGLIYLCTLYPLAYWHAHLPRPFTWFVDGDFVTGLPHWVAGAVGYLYLIMGTVYLAKEIALRNFNVPKQLVMLGTATSWYVGIVALDADMAFTLINVAAHGIPYMGLVWIYGHKQFQRTPEQQLVGRVRFKHIFAWRTLPFYLGVLLILAFVEEGLWDGLVWRERLNFFVGFDLLPAITDHSVLALLVPLLTLPQSTHYVLDGFIWKLRDLKSI